MQKSSDWLVHLDFESAIVNAFPRTSSSFQTPTCSGHLGRNGELQEEPLRSAPVLGLDDVRPTRRMRDGSVEVVAKVGPELCALIV